LAAGSDYCFIWWRKGYASEALSRLTGFLFEDVNQQIPQKYWRNGLPFLAAVRDDFVFGY
jgi:hypothetical protein